MLRVSPPPSGRPSRRARRGMGLLLLAPCVWACGALLGPLAPLAAEERTLELHERWQSLEPFAFERWLEGALPGDAEVELSATDRDALVAALDGMQPAAVRAAAVLARTATPAGHELLLARLERRVAGPARASDAGDVVAAAALSAGPLSRAEWRDATRERLTALAVGNEPHPDLEVRTECAIAALELGADEPIEFLVRVLRIGTHAGARDPRPWANVSRSAWARDRAARALSRRAGLPLSFRADASIADREAAAGELERALAR